MKYIPLLFITTFLYSQEVVESPDSITANQVDNQTVSSDDSLSMSSDPLDSENISIQQNEPIEIGPLTLDVGYKGFLWGSSFDSSIPSPFNLLYTDSLNRSKSFSGILGKDSVAIVYNFADSGFWKVEIDFILDHNDFESQIDNFRRVEKNLSSIYGPPKNINQKESGVTSSYSNILNQKFSIAIYRSTWDVVPAMVDLYLNAHVLNPQTDLSIFSGNFSFLKLVYFNPDFMHSNIPLPEQKPIPSIFDIY